MKQEKNTVKKPVIIKVDKTLDKYVDKEVFKEKVNEANRILKTVGLPRFQK
jgi:hypothetical protein